MTFRVHATIHPEVAKGSPLGGSLRGTLWLECAEGAFPAAHWPELVVPVLTQLIDGAMTLGYDGATARVDFYSGPYSVELSRISVQELLVVGLRVGRPAVREAVAERVLLRGLRGAARSSLNELSASRAWQKLIQEGTAQVSHLASSLRQLCEYESRRYPHGQSKPRKP